MCVICRVGGVEVRGECWHGKSPGGVVVVDTAEIKKRKGECFGHICLISMYVCMYVMHCYVS